MPDLKRSVWFPTSHFEVVGIRQQYLYHECVYLWTNKKIGVLWPSNSHYKSHEAIFTTDKCPTSFFPSPNWSTAILCLRYRTALNTSSATLQYLWLVQMKERNTSHRFVTKLGDDDAHKNRQALYCISGDTFLPYKFMDLTNQSQKSQSMT